MPADLHTELKKKYAVQTNPQANRGADDDEDESTSKTRVQSRYMEWHKKGASQNFKKNGTSNSKSRSPATKAKKSNLVKGEQALEPKDCQTDRNELP